MQLLADGNDCTYEQLTEVMATTLAEYMIGERELLHPSTGRLVKVLPTSPNVEGDTCTVSKREEQHDLQVVSLLTQDKEFTPSHSSPTRGPRSEQILRAPRL